MRSRQHPVGVHAPAIGRISIVATGKHGQHGSAGQLKCLPLRLRIIAIVGLGGVFLLALSASLFTSIDWKNSGLTLPENLKKQQQPQSSLVEFSKEIPNGVTSKKPISFFRAVQQAIDNKDSIGRCKQYGFEYKQRPTKRRIFYGSLIAEEPWELLEIVAAESYGIYSGMVLVEGNRTQNFVPRPVRRANNYQHHQKLRQMFGKQMQLQIRFYYNEQSKFRGIRREHAQRQEILLGWKDMGMTADDVGIIGDMDETFTRDFLRAIQECDNILPLDYSSHHCFTSQVKIASASRVFETSPECVTDIRSWYHPDMVLGACIEYIGDEAVHPLAPRDGPRREHGYGRACTRDFSKLEAKNLRHPLWSASDFRMLCGQQQQLHAINQSTYTGFHFHNFFADFRATRLKYDTYGHALKAKQAFAAPIEELDGKNDLKLMYRCVMDIPDDLDQKWKRLVGGINSTQFQPPLPVYFHDVEYRLARHTWVQDQVRLDDQERLKVAKKLVQSHQKQNPRENGTA